MQKNRIVIYDLETTGLKSAVPVQVGAQAIEIIVGDDGGLSFMIGHDPYEVMWKNKVEKFDIMAVIAMFRSVFNWKLDDMKLTTVYSALLQQSSPDDAHDALTDVKMCVELMEHLGGVSPRWLLAALRAKTKKELESYLNFIVDQNKTGNAAEVVLAQFVPYGNGVKFLFPYALGEFPGYVEAINLSGGNLERLMTDDRETILQARYQKGLSYSERPAIETIKAGDKPLLIPLSFVQKNLPHLAECCDHDKINMAVKIAKHLGWRRIEGKDNSLQKSPDKDPDGRLYERFLSRTEKVHLADFNAGRFNASEVVGSLFGGGWSKGEKPGNTAHEMMPDLVARRYGESVVSQLGNEAVAERRTRIAGRLQRKWGSLAEYEAAVNKNSQLTTQMKKDLVGFAKAQPWTVVYPQALME